MNGPSLGPGAPSSKQTPLHCPYFHHFALGRGEQGCSWLQASMRGLVLQEPTVPCTAQPGPCAKGSWLGLGAPSPTLSFRLPSVPATSAASHAPSISRRGRWGAEPTQLPALDRSSLGEATRSPAALQRRLLCKVPGLGLREASVSATSRPCDRRPSPEPPSLSFSFSSYKMGL